MPLLPDDTVALEVGASFSAEAEGEGAELAAAEPPAELETFPSFNAPLLDESMDDDTFEPPADVEDDVVFEAFDLRLELPSITRVFKRVKQIVKIIFFSGVLFLMRTKHTKKRQREHE